MLPYSFCDSNSTRVWNNKWPGNTIARSEHLFPNVALRDSCCVKGETVGGENVAASPKLPQAEVRQSPKSRIAAPHHRLRGTPGGLWRAYLALPPIIDLPHLLCFQLAEALRRRRKRLSWAAWIPRIPPYWWQGEAAVRRRRGCASTADQVQ
jgi:hypothetical protein